MAQIKAGLAIVEALRAEGVEYIFGVVGTTTNSIVTELYGREDIRLLDTRHEEGSAFMSYGYARASGKPAVCLTTSGPATINLATLAAVTRAVRAPVIAIGGVTPERVADVRAAGARGVGVISGILAAASPGDETLRYIKELASSTS